MLFMWPERFIAQKKAMEKCGNYIQYWHIADSMLDASLFWKAFSPNKHITALEDAQTDFNLLHFMIYSIEKESNFISEYVKRTPTQPKDFIRVLTNKQDWFMLQYIKIIIKSIIDFISTIFTFYILFFLVCVCTKDPTFQYINPPCLLFWWNMICLDTLQIRELIFPFSCEKLKMF